MKNINEIRNYINDLKYCGCFDEIDFSRFGNLKFKFKEKIDSDEHRWYVIETNVYEISNDDEVIGLLAVEEVGMLKSESMYIEDCGVEVKAYNVKEIMKPSFEIVRERRRMTAQEMFEKLGFKQVLCINLNQKDGKQVIYESVIGDNDTLLVKREIHFFDDVFYANLYYFNDETETFENQGGCSINIDLLKAINKQCEELWGEENETKNQM